MRAALAPYLTSDNVTTFIVIIVIVPLLSLLIRLRRRRRLRLRLGTGTPTLTPKATVNTADLVRRRLNNVNGRETGVIGRAWTEMARIVGDAVRMGGSGLV